MIPHLIVLCCLVAFWRLIKLDAAHRPGVSSAIWIPTLWMGILASRPVSLWLGIGGGDSTLEGSPADRAFFFGCIVAALMVLPRRGINMEKFIRENWSIFLFYGFLLLSVTWANSPSSSLKRWIKEFGNIPVLLVILTEEAPVEALKAVFVRCGLVLIPMSLVFIRWFPDMGRRYNQHNGMMEAIGVTCQKNSLGAMIVVTGLMVFWDLLDWMRKQDLTLKARRFGIILRVAVLAIGIYLLNMSDSKTSMICMTVGGFIICAIRLPALRARLTTLGVLGVAAYVAFLLLGEVSGIKEYILNFLGRDDTLTGRTEVWSALLGLHTDPMLGTGFMSLWDDVNLRSRLPEWVAFSAHNGYLETYLSVGYVGVFFLAVMILAAAVKAKWSLVTDGDYGVIRCAMVAVAIIANVSESDFATMTPVGFYFLIASIGHVEALSIGQYSKAAEKAPEESATDDEMDDREPASV